MYSNSIRIIEQWEIQRRGGKCARYPSSCIVVQLLDEAGLLRPLQPLSILDLTYGEGRFWAALSQAVVAGFDVRRLGWVRRPRCFWRAPAQHWQRYTSEIEECLAGRPQLIAVDPPWQRWQRGREVGGRYYYRAANAWGAPEEILRAAAEAAQHWQAPLLVHYATRWLPPGFTPVVEMWWRPWFHLLNKKASNYKSWWAVLRPGRG